MRKLVVVLGFMVAMAYAATAMATVWTVRDEADFVFGKGATYEKTLDLADDGFSSGDTVFAGLLYLNFSGTGKITKLQYDSQKLKEESVLCDLLLFIDRSEICDGKVDLVVKAHDTNWSQYFGSLTLEDVWLVATGKEAAPVPEPASMLLLGAGLFGISVLGKRSRKQSLR